LTVKKSRYTVPNIKLTRSHTVLKFSRLLLLASTVLTLGSCATIVSGTDQAVNVQTQPVSADVVITANTGIVFYDGQAPATVNLPRKNEYTVTVSMDGYEDRTVPITQGFNAWVVGNLLCGGIPRGVIDLITGAFYELEPSQVSIELRQAYNGNTSTVFLVFNAVDEQGQLRSMVVPMIPEVSPQTASLQS
jgi:hypothetical protein